jgi:hypothetical protein
MCDSMGVALALFAPRDSPSENLVNRGGLAAAHLFFARLSRIMTSPDYRVERYPDTYRRERYYQSLPRESR